MYTAIQDTPIVVDLLTACNDTGWTVDGTVARHVTCNSGLISILNYPVTAGNAYKVSYIVLNISSGNIQLRAGGTNGPARTTADIYVETIIPVADGVIQFYSNANCEVTSFNLMDTTDQIGTSIVFSATNNKWSDFRNQYPDFGWSIYTKTIMGFNGQLYSAQNGGGGNTNNFFGTQYQSSITFAIAKNPQAIKDFQMLNYQANMLMVTPLNGITSSNGQVTTLIDTDFIKQVLTGSGLEIINYQVDGVYSASILGDQDEDNIVNSTGMRGNYLIVTLVTADGSTPLQLFTIGVRTRYVPIGYR